MILDPNSPAVRKLIIGIEGYIEKKRDGLERQHKTQDETQFLRGEIKAYRHVLEILTDTGDETE